MRPHRRFIGPLLTTRPRCSPYLDALKNKTKLSTK
jgi:hypothetical protein